MDFKAFAERAEAGETCPDAFADPLKALWADKSGDWNSAHELSQAARSKDGDWVHAYLHRKEGDEGNARYWYSRSGHSFFEGSLDDEWERLVKAML